MALRIGDPENTRAGPPLKLPAIPPYAMTAAQFAARAIAIAVYPIMEGGRLCLAPADEQAEEAVERFKVAVQPMAPESVDAQAWAASKVFDLFDGVNKNLEGDVWYSALPSSEPLLVIKQAAIDNRNMSLDEAIRRTHLAQVAAAVRANLSIPEVVMDEYRLAIEGMIAREVPA